MDNWNRLSDLDKTKRSNLQISLEEDLLDYSIGKYWKSVDVNPLDGPAEQHLVKDYIRASTRVFRELQESLMNDIRSKLFPLVRIPPDILAAIVITQIVEDLVDSRDLRRKIYGNGVDNAWSVAYRIGKEVKMVLGFRDARETSEGEEHYQYLNRYTKQWDKRKRDRFNKKMESTPMWTKKETMQIGTNLLRIAQAQGVVKIELKKRREAGKVKSYNEVSIDPNIMTELIRQHEQLQFLRLIYRPMLVPPVPHTTETAGGALAFERRKPTVGGQSRASQAHLDSLNILQATEWKINERVLEVMEVVYNQNEGYCNMPAYDFEQFTFTRPYPENGTTEEKISWKRDKEDQYGKWYKEVQKRAQMEIRLKLAKKMVDLGWFYHGYTCDFRGRAYTLTEMLSPQSGDFDRGLLEFATPCKVTNQGMYWLMVHVANCCDGMEYDGDEASDKDSFDDRVKWVKRHINHLRKISEDPYANNEWMDNETTKKNPSFQRLAAILDFVNALDTGYSSCPVQLDGSCNGSQHWSAIMRDPEIAALVNVSQTDKPGDLYQHVADIATNICKKADSKWPQIFYEHWDHQIPRKVLKRSTMCDAYGITDFGIRRYMREEGHLEWVGDGTDKTQAVNELSTVVRLALDGAMESSNSGKIFLQDLTEVVAGYNRHVHWTTPTGFRVVNRYTKPMIKVVQSQFYRSKGGLTLDIATVEDTDEVNTAFAVQAVPPNFIHSIDAAHMMMTIGQMWRDGVTRYSMIHDSFGCPCNDVPVMRKAINEQFYEIHSINQLELFKQNVEDALGYQLGRALPERGDLNIREVLNSEYLFG